MTDASEPRSGVVAIVDDEADIVTFLRLALEDAGYTVVATTEPRAAIELLETTRPDLICLDLLMPGQTGVSLYSEIVRHRELSALPVVILSGLANREELPALLRRTQDGPAPVRFLDKPVDLEELLDTVTALLGHLEGASP